MDVKNDFVTTKMKQVSNHKYHMILTYNINHTKNLFSATHLIRILSVMKTKAFINRIMSYLPIMSPCPLQEIKFLPGCRSLICTGVNASMTGGTMINALWNYGMSVGTMK